MEYKRTIKEVQLKPGHAPKAPLMFYTQKVVSLQLKVAPSGKKIMTSLPGPHAGRNVFAESRVRSQDIKMIPNRLPHDQAAIPGLQGHSIPDLQGHTIPGLQGHSMIDEK